MEIVTNPQEMQALAMIWRGEGLKIVLVPTMGFFHEGHLSLMRHGRAIGDRLVVSLFVNPEQFGPTEDLERYPRDLERDAALAQEAGVNVLFTPGSEQMYPEGFQTYVTVEKLSQGLCGACRPGHFRGVATVVLKLFNLVQPHVAVFGEKDYQQFMIIRRMTADLNLPMDIVGCSIVREPDGLAMSSRNTYLSPEERVSALSLSRALKGAQKLAAAGEKSREKILELVRKIITQAPHTRIDYIALVHPETLEEVDTLTDEARLILAVWVGNTRLIDNASIPEGRYTCCV
jgi:pantoate--beta-alanine ligase